MITKFESLTDTVLTVRKFVTSLQHSSNLENTTEGLEQLASVITRDFSISVLSLIKAAELKDLKHEKIKNLKTFLTSLNYSDSTENIKLPLLKSSHSLASVFVEFKRYKSSSISVTTLLIKQTHLKITEC